MAAPQGASFDPYAPVVDVPGTGQFVVSLASGAARGPWALVDPVRDRVRVGRGLGVIRAAWADDASGRLWLLTSGGLAEVDPEVDPMRVRRRLSRGLARGKADHDDHAEPLGGDRLVVGRHYGGTTKVVDLATGDVVQRWRRDGPFTVGHEADGRAAIWWLRHGVRWVRTRTTDRMERAPLAVAACPTPSGTFALLGVAPAADSVTRAAALDLAPAWLARRLGILGDVRLALLDASLQPIRSEPATWPVARHVAACAYAPRVTPDGGGRVALVTEDRMLLIDLATFAVVADVHVPIGAAASSGRALASWVEAETALTVASW